VTIEDNEKAPDIRQISYEGTPEAKLNGALWVLQQNRVESAIIFCNLKATVIELTRLLASAGLSASAIHGDLEQSDRDRVMAKFRNQSTRILVATDVAARGIDIENLDLVVNFDLPAQPEVYVHRIGRTGRAGKRGMAISLTSTRELSKLERIETYTGKKIDRKQLPKVENADFQSLAKNAQQDAKMATLFIGGGRKDKMRPGDILGALTGEAGGLDGSKIGKIEIHDRFSYVAVSKDVAHLALERLRNGRIKGRKFRIEPVR
jgi:ATP-independent RNA helicase DbpA